MIPTRFTDTHIGDMFVIRNAGNLVPHSQHFQDEYSSCEPVKLEFQIFGQKFEIQALQLNFRLVLSSGALSTT